MSLVAGSPSPARSLAAACAIFLSAVARGAQVQASIWSASGDATNRGLGWKVAGAGDIDHNGHADIVVGSRNPLGNNATDTGRAYVYMASATGQLPSQPTWTFSLPIGAPPADQQIGVGFSVDGAGDVNGDGYADVIVGAHRSNNGEFDEGRAYVFLGSMTGLTQPPTPDWYVESNQDNAQFGFAVAGIGDINGDGYDDVAVGAPFYDNGTHVDQGRVFVYLGSSRGLSVAPVWTYTHSVDARDDGALLGYDVDGAGDVNGDG